MLWLYSRITGYSRPLDAKTEGSGQNVATSPFISPRHATTAFPHGEWAKNDR